MYKFYMQECLYDGTLVDGTKRDLEADFEGLRYSKCTGLNSYGKPKNIYTESYAEADKVRVFVPEFVKYEAVDVTFVFYFFGDADTRQKTLDDFIAYASHGYHYYWDTARKKRFMFIAPMDELSVSDENWYAGRPYIEVKWKFKNIEGRSLTVESL